MEKIIQAILNFFRSIFGGKSSAENSYIPQIPTDLQPIPEKPKAPIEIAVLPSTPVTEKPEPPIKPKPVVKPTVVEKPKTIEEKAQVIQTPIKEQQVVETPTKVVEDNTLIIKLERYSKGKEEILGKLSIQDKLVCYTLEDQEKDVKVKGATCIPKGEYEISLRNAGAMNDTYSRRFSAIHKGMLWLRNVPNFEYIFIHVGNTSADTMGCILLGTTPLEEANTETRRAIEGSSAAYQKVYPIVAEHISKGGKAIIKITDKA